MPAVTEAAGVAFPTADARSAFVAFLKANRTRVRTIHVALEGRGFWSATMSALAATVARAVPHGPEIQVHASVETAVAALVARLGPDRTSSVDCTELATVFRRAG